MLARLGDSLSDRTELELRLAEYGASDARLDQLAGKLRVAVLGGGALHARPLPASPPGNTKTDLGFVLGALVVTLQPEALGALVDTVRQWLSGKANRTVVISLDGDTLEVTGASLADQHRLIDAFLRRHDLGAGPSPRP